METQQVCILGATGSIGRSTLDVIAMHPDRFEVYALTAFNNIDTLVRLAWESRAQVVVVPDQVALRRFTTLWPDRKSTRLNSSHVAISYAVFCLKKKNDRYPE